jgi:prevent-host-death family protein
MKSIGIRELRQDASAVLRQVGRGTTFEVTDRGQPVALLTPLPETTPLEMLRAAGETQPPKGELHDLPRPLPLPKRKSPPSVVLARLRADER